MAWNMDLVSTDGQDIEQQSSIPVLPASEQDMPQAGQAPGAQDPIKH